jgi:hypothetical protein
MRSRSDTGRGYRSRALIVTMARTGAFPVIIGRTAGLGLTSLDQRRGFRDGFVAANRQAAQDSVVETKAILELIESRLITFDIHQHEMRLEHFMDGIRQLAPAPVFQAMNSAGCRFDNGTVSLDHGRNLGALIGVNQEHDFVMSHDCSSRFEQLSARAVKQGVTA